MKKLSCIALLVCFIMNVQGFALDGLDKMPSSNGITIELAVDNDKITINGTETTIEKPYLVNDVTLVPLRVISEAFGANVDWNGETQTATITYSGITIKVTIGKNEAMINDAAITIPAAPSIVNGTTMVPLRFICENFGADVSYKEATSKIVVKKEMINDNSIKDFALILKKSSKELVGDSYYQWSLKLPKNLKIKNRSFGGTNVIFGSDDSDLNVSLYIAKHKKETLKSVASMISENFSSYNSVLSEIDKITLDGVEGYRFYSKGSDTADEGRLFIANEHMYFISATYRFEKDTEDTVIKEHINGVLDTFHMNFKKDGGIEDLSDISEDGSRLYENKKLGWTAKIPGDWSDERYSSYSSIESQITFNEGDYMPYSGRYDYYDGVRAEQNEIVPSPVLNPFSSLSPMMRMSYNNRSNNGNNYATIKMFSKEKGYSLEDHAKKVYDSLIQKYNPKYITTEPIISTTINNETAKILKYTIKIGDTTTFLMDCFLTHEKYKYQISYSVDQVKEDQKDLIKQLDGMVNSFTITKIDEEKVGEMRDPESKPKIEGDNLLEDEDGKWSVNVPASWVSDSYSASMIMNTETNATFMINSNKNFYSVKIDDMTSMIDKSLEDQVKSGVAKLISKDQVHEKDIDMVKYVVKMVSYNEDETNLTVYMFIKDGYTYTILFSVDEIYNNAYIQKSFDEIWKSLVIK